MMLDPFFITLILSIYLAFLIFAAAKLEHVSRSSRVAPLVYVLGLAVYCTSWTFFGSVGLAANSGWAFAFVYLGPIFLFIAGRSFLQRFVDMARDNNVTSLADFLGARYGKSRGLAVMVTLTMLLVSLPYLALQIKAIDNSVGFLVASDDVGEGISLPLLLVLAFFATSFIGRDGGVSARSNGLLVTVVIESALKITAAVLVGGSLMVLFAEQQVFQQEAWQQISIKTPPWPDMAIITLISAAAALCLPRQFHMMVLEYPKKQDGLKTASWGFPLYLVLINLFVVPVAMIGSDMFGQTPMPADLYLLAVPSAVQADWLAVLALLGGFSAATAMILVTSFALSTMITNEVMVPTVLTFSSRGDRFDARKLVIYRRAAIVLILLSSYMAYRWMAHDRGLAEIGLVSFAGVAQFAPPLVAAVLWQKASKKGAVIGLSMGLLSWVCLVMVPELGLGMPQLALEHWFPGVLLPLLPGETNFAQATLLSIGLNVVCLVLFSKVFPATKTEHLQTLRFTDPFRAVRRHRERVLENGYGTITVGDLRQLLEPYLGENAVQQLLREKAEISGQVIADQTPVSITLLRDGERLLAGVLGVSSARLVLGMALERQRLNVDVTMSLLDDATEAIQYSRAVLEATIENVSQGIGVFDQNLTLICRNEHFVDRLRLPQRLVGIGTPLEDILVYLAQIGDFGPGDIHDLVAQRMAVYRREEEERLVRTRPDGTVLEIITTPIPNLGVVASYNDITDEVRAQETLKMANALLECRVGERTRELRDTNKALRQAQLQAEQANRSKTRFLAAASHDLLQPLNAARLFVSSLEGRIDAQDDRLLLQRAEVSLAAVDDLLNTLLDITKLDAGVMPVHVSQFPLDDILAPLTVEFSAFAERKNLKLIYVPTTAMVRSDPKLLRRVVANFLANAVRYTEQGRILLGCRHQNDQLILQVIDTGVGIDEQKIPDIFKEFSRLESTENMSHGLGLGLSIVQRIANALGHELGIASKLRKGTLMSISLPKVAHKKVFTTKPVKAKPQNASGFEGLRVWVIDDEPDIRLAMKTLLERWKLHVEVFATAGDVLRSCEQVGPPDLLLADNYLSSQVTGMDVITQIKHKNPAAKAVLITADRTDALKSHADNLSVPVLYKPLRPAALRATLMHLVQRADP